MRRAVVLVVAAAFAELDLQRRVVDPEALVQALVDPVEEGIVAFGAGADQVGRHRDLARAQRPDVHVVGGLDALLRLQPRAYLGGVERGGHRVHRGVEGVVQQAEGADRDHRADQQRGRRIQPGPAEPEHADAGEHGAQRDGRVGHQVQEGAAAVEVLVMAAAHEPRGAEVDRDADRGDHDHWQRRDLRRRVEAAHRFPGERAGEADQQQGVGQRREQGGATPAVGMALGRQAPREHGGAPGQAEPEHVTEVVQRIGQQRQRVGGEAIAGLEHGVGEVDQGRDRERPRRVPVEMLVPVHRSILPLVGAAQAATQRAPRPSTSVPISSPRRIFSKVPGCDMSNTRSGSSLSRARANAAVSITCRSRAMTSS